MNVVLEVGYDMSGDTTCQTQPEQSLAWRGYLRGELQETLFRLLPAAIFEERLPVPQDGVYVRLVLHG